MHLALTSRLAGPRIRMGAAASMQTQCDDQCVCQVRWSVWWSVCLPREFPPLLFELGIKEVPDLAVSPCKCRVPLLSAMNMSKQFFETSCHGMSDAWSSSVHRAFRNGFLQTHPQKQLPQACKLSVMIRVFAKCDDQCDDQCVCHVSFLFHFSS